MWSQCVSVESVWTQCVCQCGLSVESVCVNLCASVESVRVCVSVVAASASASVGGLDGAVVVLLKARWRV